MPVLRVCAAEWAFRPPNLVSACPNHAVARASGRLGIAPEWGISALDWDVRGPNRIGRLRPNAGVIEGTFKVAGQNHANMICPPLPPSFSLCPVCVLTCPHRSHMRRAWQA